MTRSVQLCILIALAIVGSSARFESVRASFDLQGTPSFTTVVIFALRGVLVSLAMSLVLFLFTVLVLSISDLEILKTITRYMQCLFYFWFQRGTYKDCPYFTESKHARAQVYSLALIPMLWEKPHYRSASLQVDLLDNLKNVAIPGTGIALSWFCHFKFQAYLFLMFGVPLICLFAALRDRSPARPTRDLFEQYLLCPTDWFSLWQLNCRLSSVHSYATKAKGYLMESKWEFLVEGEARGVPVSPYLRTPRIVLKNKLLEGGLGIHFFQNASAGGEWIIQPMFENAPVIASLLTKDAPLSTIRIITMSRGALNPSAPTQDITGNELNASQLTAPLTAVFRAGRAGATTDHKSVLYDLNHDSNKIVKGRVNSHWYNVGLQHCNLFQTKSSVADDAFDCHPDSGTHMIGQEIANVKSLFTLCQDSHFKLLPDVPIVGWDVALTPEGACLLEANLSCNFFMGSFDKSAYLSFVDQCFAFSDELLH